MGRRVSRFPRKTPRGGHVFRGFLLPIDSLTGFILPRTNVWEVPEPHDTVAIVHNGESLDAGLGMLRDLGDPLVPGGGRGSIAKLQI